MTTNESNGERLANLVQTFGPDDSYHKNNGDLNVSGLIQRSFNSGYYAALDRVAALLRGEDFT